MEIVFLIALIVLNGVFAMSEIALVSARSARLARLAEDGAASAGWRPASCRRTWPPRGLRVAPPG